MKFCPKCKNMFYVAQRQVPTPPQAAGPDTSTTLVGGTSETKLVYYCRLCRTVDESANETFSVVLDNDVCLAKKCFQHIVNEYTKFDPTLPALKDVPCPNDKCASNHDAAARAANEVIYVRYDDENLKYLYLCSTCDAQWTTD